MAEIATQEQEVRPRKEDFFELIVNHPNQASPFLQFSWCVNNKGIEYLREEKVLHPFLLIVILNKKPYSDDCEDYDRQLYPLDRGLGHIEFSRPGEYKIHASVVWTRESAGGNTQKAADARKKIYDEYLDVKHDKFKQKLHDEAAYRPDYLDHPSLPYHDKINVMVDENLFAPEPSYRMKWWVNMMWSGHKPKNQCEWRRRKIIAFTIQPFLVALFLAFRSAFAAIYTAFLLLIGFYPNRIGWKAIIHPFDMDLDDIASKNDFKNGRNYWWLADPARKERSRLEKILMSPITAYAFTVVLLLAVALNIFRMAAVLGSMEWNILFVCLIAAVIVMVSGLVLCRIMEYIIDRFFAEKLEKRARERAKHKWDEEDAKRKREARLIMGNLSYFYEQRLQPLACTERKREATLASLPSTHRTLQLRFMDLKVKVCKPFRN